jgi:hypothetical protein
MMEAIKLGEQEVEKNTQDEESHREADELLKAETDMLYHATLALQRAREEFSPRNGSVSTWGSPAEGSFVVHSPGDICFGGDPILSESTTPATRAKSTEDLDLNTLQDDADHEHAERMADPFMQEEIARHRRPHDNWPHEATLEKLADEEVRRLGILHLEATMKTMKEELANLEAVKKELDDQKLAKVEANQDVSDDDDNLDSYSDSVEKWELKDG